MYGVNNSSDAISRDMNSLLYSSSFKHPADSEFSKIKQLISLDSYLDYEQSVHSPNKNINHCASNKNDAGETNNAPTLVRYRSTPSSFFSNLLNENDEFPDHGREELYFMEQLKETRESDARETSMKQETREVASQNLDLLGREHSGYGYTKQGDLDLVRQTSSPAGFLSTLTGEKGFAGMKDVRKGGSSSAMNNHISFSLGSSSSSSSRFMPQIAENENELDNSTFNSLKRSRDGGLKMQQNGENGNHTPSLVHHMSLPKTSSEMTAVDNFLHFQQETSVPWKTRAKRGFATHPRSIAERVRRTRISERIKRLQELFPDMDKQTNTADMLDMAVKYIKDLQKELQTLNNVRARCKCSSTQLQSGSTM